MTATPDTSKQLIGKRLQEARKLAGLSQAQVAKLLGIHRPSVSEIEAGNRRVSADELKTLCDTYEISIDWVIGNKPEKVSADDDRLQLAARELAKLQPDEVDKLLRLFSALKSDPDDSSSS